MNNEFLLSSSQIFDGGNSIDCVRQSLLTLATEKVNPKDIAIYLEHALTELNSLDINDIMLDELLLIIRQCFDHNDPIIHDKLAKYLENPFQSRGHLLASIVALNGVVKSNPDYKVDDSTTKFLNQIAEELAPQFHSFKLKKRFVVNNLAITQSEALSMMLCIIKLIPISTEVVLAAVLFLWHSDIPQKNSSMFLDLISEIKPELFQELFKTIPRERFLFLCSDPQAPSTICPSIAIKLNDFSDVSFFLKSLPMPQLHLSEKTIEEAIKNITDCKILTPRLKHSLLSNIDTWKHILTIIDESSIESAAKCFITNIVDIADGISQLLLTPEIKSIQCQFINEVLEQDSEARSQLSRSEMLAYIISTLTRSPPIEFWQMINSPEPFRLLPGIEKGEYPVAFLGLIYYLISSNRIFDECYFESLTLPDIEPESKENLINYLKQLDGTPSTLFGNIPSDSNLILLIAISIYTSLSSGTSRSTRILNENKNNHLFFLTLQLASIQSLIKHNRFIDSFLMKHQSKYDSLKSVFQELSNVDELDDLCICTIFDILASYEPFYNAPSVASNILLITSYIFANKAMNASKGITYRFSKSLRLLDQILINSPFGNRSALNIRMVFHHLGKTIFPFMIDNFDFFSSNKLDIRNLFESEHECQEFCTKFFTENCSLKTISFYQNCFISSPIVKIEQGEKIEAIYKDCVSKDQWNDASCIASFLSNSNSLEIIHPTADEVINILIHCRVPYDEILPDSLLSLIQSQLDDDDTQVSAMVSYFLSAPEVSLVDIRRAIFGLTHYFKGHTDRIIKTLSHIFEYGPDPHFHLIRRPEPLSLDSLNLSNSLHFIKKLINAVIENPSQKMLLFLRATLIPYAFLFRKIEKSDIMKLINSCLVIIDQFDQLNVNDVDLERFNHIQSANLLLSVLLTEPIFCDYFFSYFAENVATMSAPRLYVSIHFFIVLFSKSRFFTAAAASYFLKNDLFNQLSINVLRVQETTKMKQNIFIAFNNLIDKALTFFANLTEIDIVDIDEMMKCQTPFYDLIQPGQMRSGLSLTSIQAFGPFDVDDQLNHFIEMAKTVLPVPTGPEVDFQKLLFGLKDNELFKPTEIDQSQLPPTIDRDRYMKMKPIEQSIYLREMIPRFAIITPSMMRVLLRQPAWIKIAFLQQNASGLLLPEHYLQLIKVVEEMKNANSDLDLNKQGNEYISQVFFQEEYIQFVLNILTQKKDLRKDLLVQTLDNLGKMLSFDPAVDKCIELIIPPLRKSNQPEDLTIAYTILMVMAKTGAACEKIYSFICDDFFTYFLQPKWRNDKDKLELISALVTTFIDKAYHCKLILPWRILHLICFMYLNGLYSSASSISLYLTDEQKRFISPFIHHVFDHLRSLDDETSRLNLIQLCRAYPYLNFDKTRILRSFDMLLATSQHQANLEILSSLINVLIPDEFLEIDDEEEKKYPDVVPPLSFPLPVSVYIKFPEFWRVISNHRVTLTKIAHILRFSQNATSSFKFLFKFPIIIDVHLKVDYFNYLIKKSLQPSNQRFELNDDDQILQNSIAKIKSMDFSEWRKEFTPTILNSDKDWYETISQMLFTSDLFKLTPNNRCVQINSSNTNYDMYRFAGFFVALCLLHNKKINAHFAPSIFKKILGLPCTLRDVEIVDVVLARSYRHMLDKDANNLGLFFTATSLNDENQPIEVELIPDGAQTPVNDDNKEHYVQLMINFRFNTECKKQLDSFIDGFNTIIKRHEIQMFNAQELEMLICGIPKIDINDMIKNVEIHAPYSLEHPLIKKFFAMLRKWNHATLGKLLWFVTGSAELPIGGFKELKNKGITIQIEKGNSIDCTPEAHTCFQTLVIPEYPSLDLMERMFFIALDENI